jgi:hypothetical protein
MIMTKKYRAGAATPNAAGNKCMEKHYDCIVPLTRQLVKLAITADLVFGLAALGSLNIPGTITALLALNLLCGLYFKEETRHEEI